MQLPLEFQRLTAPFDLKNYGAGPANCQANGEYARLHLGRYRLGYAPIRMIRFSYAIEIAATPAEVFVLLDDLKATPLWLARCVKVELEPLRYHFRQGGGRVGVMSASIATRVPNQQLVIDFRDNQANVQVDQQVAASRSNPNATLLTCSVAVQPRSLAGKLLTPLIRKYLPSAVTASAERLKAQAEVTPAA